MDPRALGTHGVVGGGLASGEAGEMSQGPGNTASVGTGTRPAVAIGRPSETVRVDCMCPLDQVVGCPHGWLDVTLLQGCF